MSLFKDKIELGIQEAELGTQQALSRIPTAYRWLLILLLIATFPAYYIAKNISEKIWLSRYQQGQVLAKPSFTNQLPPKISPVSVTTLGQGAYAAVVEVSNQNLNLSANQVPFEFTFFNSEKQKIYSYTDKLFLLPNQTKYITVPTFKSSETISYANFEFPENINWQKKLSIPTIKLITSVPNYYQQSLPQAFVVEGDFVNQSPYTLNQVRLNFVLLDSSGKIIGVSQRDEYTVAPSERRTYKQLWPEVVANNVQNVKVSADTNVLDPNDLILPALPNVPSSNASNLNRR